MIGGTTMTEKIFSNARYQNFFVKSLIVLFVVLNTLGIYWKKKRILLRIPKYQRNVLTLNQTVAVILWLYTNNILCDYLLAIFPPSEFLFILEELRVLLGENIVTKFLLPICLILNTRRTLPALWTEKSWKRREFFMTNLDFPKIEVVVQEERRYRYLVKHNDTTTTTTTTTTLANTAMGSNLPEISEWRINV